MAKTLQSEILLRVAAGMPGIWIQTSEHEEAIDEITSLCRQPGSDLSLCLFDIDRGSRLLSPFGVPGPSQVLLPGHIAVEPSAEEGGQPAYVHKQQSTNDPSIVLRGAPGLVAAGGISEAGLPSRGILVFDNLPMYMNSARFIQQLANTLWEGRPVGLHIIVLAYNAKMPVELQKLFESGIIQHQLPDKAQREAIFTGTVPDTSMPESPEVCEQIIEAASGLTSMETETAFGLAAASGEMTPDSVYQLKASSLDNVPGLSLYRGEQSFDDIGGFAFLKKFCTGMIRNSTEEFRPRGVLLIGLSGGGKSLFAKALGREVGRPTISLDFGATLGGVIGQSQAQFRTALDRVDAISPCILFGDEVDKMLAGVGDDAKTSGGVRTDMFGELLRRMEDSKKDVFYVFTCNDIRNIADRFPEFLRRFDALFFIDVPAKEVLHSIWDIHLHAYRLLDPEVSVKDALEAGDLQLPDDRGWTGADVERCCRQARLRKTDVKTVGNAMPKLTSQSAEVIRELRTWADGKCYSTEQEALYACVSGATGGAATGATRARRVVNKKRVAKKAATSTE